MKILTNYLRACVLAMFVASPLILADDTDIYFSAFGGVSKPLVMLTLDIRSNLASTQCSDVLSDGCRTNLSDDLYFNLDLVTHNDPSDLSDIGYGPDGVPDGRYYGYGTGTLNVTGLRAAWTAGMNLPGSYMDSKARLFDLLRAAFQFVLAQDKVQNSGVWIGLMVTHEHDNGCGGPGDIPNNSNQNGCSGGAYVLKEFFDVSDQVELADFSERLAAVPTPTYTPINNSGQWNGHTYQLAELYYEFYRYITGQGVYSGLLGYSDYNSSDAKKTLDLNNDAPYAPGDARNALVAPAPDAYTGSGASAMYVSPFANDPNEWACSGLYMINTVFGVSQQDSDSNDGIDSALPGGLGLSLGNSNNDSDRETLIRTMFEKDLAGYDAASSTQIGFDVEGNQNLTSFVLADTTNNKQDGWADAGGTDFALSLGSGAEIAAALDAVFDSIISESSTLVSASVPVNVFNRAEAVDNVYFAIFQAESGSRWPGNIKKLKLGTRTVDVVDDLGVPTGETVEVPQIEDNSTPPDSAFDPLDGRIKRDAITYWTDTLAEDVTPNNCADGVAPLDAEEFCGSDGRSVVRGGAGQQHLGFKSTDATCSVTGPGITTGAACARNLYTEDPNDPLVMLDFNADVTTADKLLGVLDPDNLSQATALKLIKWARGDTELSGALAEVPGAAQRWMHGDVLHGRPLPINYGDTEGDGDSGYGRNNPNVRLYYGANDGWFRQVKNTNADGSESGEEMWGFMPTEVMGIQEDLARDILPSTGHPYGVDGDVTSLVIDRNSNGSIENGVNDGVRGDADAGDKVFVYYGLRRGGNAYYAMDVSNPDAAPKLMWKISNTGDFSELGMTWSAPRVAIVNYNGTRSPVLIFGGGYNGGWNAAGNGRIGKDIYSNNPTADTVGNAFFVVDAITGLLIWKATGESSTSAPTVYGQADLDHSIASDVTVIDSDLNDISDMAYVGDTGGDLWRIDMPESSGSDNRENWSMTRVGSFGGSGASDRRFFHAPDVVLARDEETVSGVTSSREYIGLIINSGDRPHPSDTDPDNFMYFIKDAQTASGSVTANRSIGHAVLPDITTLCSGLPCTPPDSNGWKLSLNANGEKGLAKPVTVGGVVFFATFLPEGEASAGVCDSGAGTGRLYAVNVADGTPANPPGGVIEDGSEPDRYEILDSAGIPSDPTLTSSNPNVNIQDADGGITEIEGRFKWKVYWSELGVDEI
ncbi:MAG: PilC/PilY family type IV pilus protein [Halieaceae bacterium]